MQPIPLAPVDSLAVTTLVDNVTDVLLVDEGPAKRPATAISGHLSVPARFLEGGRTGDALRAEHGFSCLVTASVSGRSIRVLFDAGRTRDARYCNRIHESRHRTRAQRGAPHRRVPPPPSKVAARDELVCRPVRDTAKGTSARARATSR